ncbi:hypothetical protein QPK24_22085 [Paenibacillus polygoni]|uniref:Uncharacterized protein n=1 Tax=Paenibacillus polygoni TaxID=3050112 RepID=A0ABY8X3E8_9BACL|nr:hypothetical protein [Paenibacillus polygoni]WIV18976.1 hypothetical protein QPK24_22085 [Paenibacillus polygoni]
MPSIEKNKMGMIEKYDAFNGVLSADKRIKPSIEKNETFPRISKIGLGLVLLVGTSTPIISHNNLGAGGNKIQIRVVNASTNTYNTQTAVYTNDKISEGSEAIQNMRSERPKTVAVNLEKSGYVKHILQFPEEDEFFDEKFTIQWSDQPANSFPLQAVIRSSGRVTHTLDFKDEV